MADEDDENDSDPEIEDDIPNTEIFSFCKQHPLYKSHGQRRRSQVAWPKIIGKRIPNLADLIKRDNNQEEELEAIRNQYAQYVLILFYPFRTLQNLKDDDCSWWESFLKRKNFIELNIKSVRTLTNIQNSYNSSKKKKDGNKQNAINPQLPSNDCDTENISDSESDFSPDETNLSDHEDVDNLICPTTEPLRPFVQVLQSVTGNQLFTLPPSNLINIERTNAIQAINKCSSKSKKMFSLPGRNLMEHNVGAENTEKNQVPDRCLGTRVELLKNILEALECNSSKIVEQIDRQPCTQPANFPTLIEHSQLWELQDDQIVAFTLMAGALLNYLSKLYHADDSQNNLYVNKLNKSLQHKWKILFPNNEQLLMYVSGAGGTGKSRIIQAIIDFARRIHANANILVTASSGIASVLIGGCTVHSALGIGINTSKPPPVTIEQMSAWAEIGLVIVDEHSMVTPELFHQMNVRIGNISCEVLMIILLMVL